MQASAYKSTNFLKLIQSHYIYPALNGTTLLNYGHIEWPLNEHQHFRVMKC